MADGFFVEAKFEQVRTNVPFPALTAVLSDLCDLVSQEEAYLPSVQEKIKKSIGKGDELALSMLVSNLSHVTGTSYPLESKSPVTGSMSQMFQRFKVACKQFIRIIVSPEHPVVVFLDDLQWSDIESLDTLRDLMTDRSSNLLVIGVYRDDESGSCLVEEMFHIGDSRVHHLKTTRVILSNLDKVGTRDLVATILRMPLSQEVMELSDILHDKTDGNPFYLKELVSSLHRSGGIKYDIDCSNWTWNTTQIRDEIDVTDNVLGIVEQRLDSLPHQLQSLLTIAAYIGFCFREDVLTDFVSHEDSDTIPSGSEVTTIVQQLLKDATKAGLIEEAGSSSFRFRHDKIQQCILDSVSVEEHTSLSCRLGWFLYAGTSTYGRHVISPAAYNLSQGLTMISDPSKRLMVASINLSAGMIAKGVASFHSAAEYAGTGLQILGTPLPWDTHYDLTTELCTLRVESKQCLGEFAEVEHLSTEILHHAKTINDKWPAHKVAIEEYGNGTGEMRKAINMCVDVARSFGDDFPKKPNTIHLIKRLFRVRRMMKHMTDEDLIRLPPLPKDDLRLVVADVHRYLQGYAFLIADEICYPLSVLKCLESFVKYGYSFITPSAISSYGLVCSMLGDYDSAIRYAALAERMISHWNFQRGGARVYLVTYGLYLHQTETVDHCVMGLKRGIDIGLASGEIEDAFYNAALFALFTFNSGRRLSEVSNLLCYLHDTFSGYDKHCVQFYLTVMAATSNLMGLSDDSTKLSNEHIDEEEVIQDAINTNKVFNVYVFQSIKASLLFHFGYFEEARVYAYKLRKEKRLGVQDHLNLFYFGLNYLEMARTQGGQHRRTSLSMARKCFKGLQRSSNDANPNTAALLRILEAENYSASAPARRWSLEVARCKYDLAISTAAQQNLPQFEALANERASMAFEQKAPELSTQYMRRAKELYWEWDAEAKFVYLEERDAERNTEQAR